MKKLIFSAVLALFVTAALAQQTPKKPSWEGFVSNGFWSNWEISAGAGAGTALSNGMNMGLFRNRINFEANISATKWFHPVIGGRFQFQGGYFNNFDAQVGKMKWPYLFMHTDFMINLSNWIGGYREDRAYYMVPFWGFGYMATNMSDKSHRDNFSGTHQTFAFTYGLLNKFRMSPSVDFNIELKGMLMPSRVSPAVMDGSYLFGFSATAGFTYRFNKRGWQRGVAGYTADDIRAFQQAVADGEDALAVSQAENARLRGIVDHAREDIARLKAVAKSAKAEAAEAKAAERAESCPSVILFDLNMARLTPQEKTRLALIADQIKSGPKDKVYSIQGHADKQTGTAAFNKQLSVKRAKAVYNFLVGKGVDAKQLTYEGLGGVDNPFPIQKANRSAVVK